MMCEIGTDASFAAGTLQPMKLRIRSEDQVLRDALDLLEAAADDRLFRISRREAALAGMLLGVIDEHYGDIKGFRRKMEAELGL